MRMECEKNVKREKLIIDEAIGASACTKADIFNAFLTADFHNEGIDVGRYFFEANGVIADEQCDEPSLVSQRVGLGRLTCAGKGAGPPIVIQSFRDTQGGVRAECKERARPLSFD